MNNTIQSINPIDIDNRTGYRNGTLTSKSRHTAPLSRRSSNGRRMLLPWTRGRRTRWKRLLLLLLLKELLLLDQLLLSDLRRGCDLGSLAVENDLRLFEVAASI